MKIEITIKWGVSSRVTYVIFNDWSIDKLNEAVRKTLDIFEFNKK